MFDLLGFLQFLGWHVSGSSVLFGPPDARRRPSIDKSGAVVAGLYESEGLGCFLRRFDSGVVGLHVLRAKTHSHDVGGDSAQDGKARQ